VEVKEKKNPIAELKENVLKHIEEKKKEKEKKKEQLESDNHIGSNNNSSSNSTQPATAAASASPSPSASSSAPYPPAVASVLPATAAPPASPPSTATVTSTPAPAASTPPALIYPSPAPASISDRFNYAAYDSGAKLLLSSPGMKKASAILSGDDDSYMMTPCSSAAKYVIVQLKEDILLDMVELVNREHYSSSVQQFSLYGSNVYPTDEWAPLGRFWADETQQAQYWRLDAGDYAVRYVKLIWETWWKDEYYCTLTQLGVYGRSVLEAFREDLDDSAEVLREVEQVLIEQNMAKEADVERKEGAKDGAETMKEGGKADAAIALTEAALQLSVDPSASSTHTSYLWDVVAFWTHQPSVDPVISQLMGVDEPPNIIVTAHSQSPTTNGRLSITSPLMASTDADKLFTQPVCPSFNVSQPLTLFPRVHPLPASHISSSPPDVAQSSDTIVVVTESDSDESGSENESEAVADAAENDEHDAADVISDVADGDSSPQSQSTPVVLTPPTATATPTSAAPTPASLFSDFIYSQMARLSKQAGAQSQAEAEKIDPHYAALLAKYTGRDKQRVVNTAPITHPSDDAAGAATMAASSSSAASDTVALVSSADVHNKGKSSSHQSIFRTLTNRLKEVELHQALSTHFVSVLSERFGAEIEQLQITLAKLKANNASQAAGDTKATVLAEDREALREELKAEVRRELQEEMQRVLDVQQRMEQRMAEMGSANLSLHTLLHQELLAIVAVLLLWTLLSSLLPPLPVRTALRYVWRGVRVVTVWSARVLWRLVVWVWKQASRGWSASGSTTAPEVSKPTHRRASSADSSRRPSTSTSAIVPAIISRQHGQAVEQPRKGKQQHEQQQQPQRPLQRPSLNHPTAGNTQQPQPSPPQHSQHPNKRRSPRSSKPASPHLCSWTLDAAQPHAAKAASSALPPSPSTTHYDDDSCDDGEDAIGSWRLEAIDSGSARPYMSPPADRTGSPRRGSWSGQSAELEQRKAAWTQQQRSGGSVGNSNTQPLPSRQPPPPLPPLRPSAPPHPSAARLSAKLRSRTADAAQLPTFIHRAMSPPATAAAVDSTSASSSTVLLQPYVSHASINSFDVLQSPERRNRPMMVK